jgi:thioredoxin-related protein
MRETTWLKTTGILLLLGALLAAAPVAAEEEKPDNRSLNWESYREASERSRREGKPLMIHFTARWCRWCTKMKLETYADRKVIRYLNEHFAMAMVDTDKLPALARKYRVEELPTLWFLDPAGKRLTRYPGFIGAARLLPLLEFIATEAYTEHDYDDWLKSRS